MPGETSEFVIPMYGPPGPVGSPDSIIETGVAAATLSGHRAVTRNADGTIGYASNDNAAYVAAPIWITTGAAVSGATVTAVAYGLITEPTWSWTPGPVYLGAAGVLTQTVPTSPGAVFLAQIGYAPTPTSIFVDRYPSIKLA